MKKILFISGWATTKDVWVFVKKNLQNHWGDDCSYGYLPWTFFVKKDPESWKDFKTFLKNGDENIIVGWSMGGMIALQLSLLGFKEVSKIILLGVSARMVTDFSYAGVNLTTIKAMKKKLLSDRKIVLRDFAAKCCSSGDLDFIDFFLDQSSQYSTDDLYAGLQYLQCTDLRKNIAQQKISSLIFHGTEDKIMLPSHAQYLNKNMPNSKLQWIDDGHGFLVSSADLISREINRFLCV